MAKHDDMVKTLQSQVAAKKLALGTRPKAVLVTNGLLKFNDKEHININTLLHSKAIVEAYSQVFHLHHLQCSAADDLGCAGYAPIISGHTLDEWKQDFQFRLQLATWNQKEAELNALTKKLESLVSEDLKTENALAEIMASLKD